MAIEPTCLIAIRHLASCFWALRADSIHDEQLSAVRRITAVRLASVANLIAHARSQNGHGAVFELGVKFAFQAEKHVALLAPMIG